MLCGSRECGPKCREAGRQEVDVTQGFNGNKKMAVQRLENQQTNAQTEKLTHAGAKQEGTDSKARIQTEQAWTQNDLTKDKGNTEAKYMR